MIQRRDCLTEHLPNKVLPDGVVSLAAAPDELLEVAAIAVLHNDVYFGSLFVDDAVVVLDDVVVGQLPQDVHLGYYLLLLLFAHDPVIKFFPDENFVIAQSLYFLDFAEGTCRTRKEY